MKMKINSITLSFIVLGLLTTCHVLAQTPENKNASSDSLYRKIQVSFVPYVGTNGFMTNDVICDISLNILAGSVKEVRSFEIGSLLNIVRGNAGKCQLSGIGNLVGGTSYGFQGAGTFNLAQKLQGVQVAGTLNFAGEASGVQISGLINHATKGKCIQIAGIVNNASEASVFQISGLVNNTPNVENFQIAGLINNASKAGQFQIAGLVNNTAGETGFQISGLVNNASKIKSFQIAGLVNNSEEVTGTQVSGLVNRTKILKGVQIGFLNITDSCVGIPIGVISLVKNGYHKIEISADEMFYSNIAFRSGIKQFHSIIMAGIKPDNFTPALWTYGCGAGSSFSLNGKTLFDIDAVFQHIIKEDNIGNNYLYKLSIGIDRQLWAKTSFYVGATYNFLVTDTKQNHYADKYSSIAPYHFTDKTYGGGFNLKTWAGFKVGLRFL